MSFRPTRSELLWLPVVAAALLVLYLPALGNALVFDDGYLADGELFGDYKSFLPLRERTLSYSSFVWVRAAFGEGWGAQRLVNLGLHLAVTLCLWGLWRELLRHVADPVPDPGEPTAPAPWHRSLALGVGIGFFALNPVAVYAVAYLIQRSIVMATLFTVLGLWAFAVALARRRPLLHLAALACYGLALLSKEHAIAAPLAALAIYVLVARPSAGRLAAMVGAALAIAAVAAWLLWSRYGHIIGKPFDEYSHVYLAQLARLDPGAQAHAYSLSILNQAYLFFQYGLRWLLPAGEWMSINLRPPFPLRWLTFPHVVGAFGYLALVAASAWLLLRHRDWRALLGLSLLLPALLFVTEFGTVWVQDPFVLYRSYLWALGIPGLVVLLLHGTPPRVLAALALVLGALLVWQGFGRVVSMSTAERAWTDAIAKLPQDERAVGRWFPYLNRGTEYVESNQFALAMRDFETSSKLGDLGMGAFNRGSLLAAQGKPREALAAFDEAERQGYDLYNLAFQRALAFLALQQLREGYAYLQLTRTLNPPSPTRELMLMHLGRTALQLGKRDEAIEALQLLLKEQPRHPEARFVLAMAHLSKGEHARGLELAEDLVRAGGGGLAYYARALAHHGLGHKAEANADIDMAIKLGPDNANLREWQAKIRAMR